MEFGRLIYFTVPYTCLVEILYHLCNIRKWQHLQKILIFFDSFLYTILPFLTYKICNIRKGKSVYILSFYCLYLHCFSLVFIGIIISILYTFQIWKVLFSWKLYTKICVLNISQKWNDYCTIPQINLKTRTKLSIRT